MKGKRKAQKKKSAASPNNARDGQSFFNPFTGASVFYGSRDGRAQVSKHAAPKLHK